MYPIYFLFPEMNMKSGGHIAQVNFMEAAQSLRRAVPVTYLSRDDQVPYLDDLLSDSGTEDAMYWVHWGPHVPGLIGRLKQRHIVYVAQSTGWGFLPPSSVPIIVGSKHTQAYWGRNSPNSLIYHLPNVISPEYKNEHRDRPIDVLIQKRKSSTYLIDQLAPALEPHCRVIILDEWVNDLSIVFNQSKVYLYDSVDHWARSGATEGFGLPPLEAMSCGCTVFSTINDGLSDYLDPGFNSHKLRAYSKQNDVDRIVAAVNAWQDDPTKIDPAMHYRRDAVAGRLATILTELDDFFTRASIYVADIPPPPPKRGTWDKAISWLWATVAGAVPSPIKTLLKSLVGKTSG